MPPSPLLKGCAEGWPVRLGPGKVKVCLGPLGARAALRIPGQRRGPRPGRPLRSSQRASERASEGGRRARPGPSCPYDRAGRRRALPSHGKRRPRRWARDWLGRELGGQAAGSGPSEPTAWARRLHWPCVPAADEPPLRTDWALAPGRRPVAALQLHRDCQASLGNGGLLTPLHGGEH